MAVRWAILRSPEFGEWYRTALTDEERDAIVATALRLQEDGPALRWYQANIPIAEAIYERHLATVATSVTTQPRKPKARGRTR